MSSSVYSTNNSVFKQNNFSLKILILGEDLNLQCGKIPEILINKIILLNAFFS